jgi:hypothetical protein
MSKPDTNVFATTPQADSLTHADALDREITDLCAQINAASYRLLQLISELDDEAPWGAWGLKSCAHWLNWRCGISLNAAREKVRVAHSLKDLPTISSAFESGQLSFSKVRALTRIAAPENEAKLLDLAFHATAAQVETLVRAYRRVDRSVDDRARGLTERDQARAQHVARELTYYHDDDGSLVIRARLPAEEGAVVLQALNAAMDAQYTGGFVDDTTDDAANDVTEETLAAGDGSLLRITDDAAGNPLNIGRKTRAVSPAMQRALRSRDHGCRFPGCTHDRFVDAHHIRHWANGGETSLDNLVLLCRRHHRLVHEGGFGVERFADGALRFTRPDDRVITEHPRLHDARGIEGFRCQSIDAADWIIPAGSLDLDLSISGLIQSGERNTRVGPYVS